MKKLIKKIGGGIKGLKPGYTNDYEGRCGNCHKYSGDQAFCPYCGTKSGEGAYEPYPDDSMQCVYGPPPVERTHKCESCGYEYTTCRMIDDERYCPKCGSGKVTITSDEGRWM